jgi:hypothetical protein
MLQIYFDKQYEAQVRADKGRVSKSDLAGVETRSEKRVDDYYYFPSKVRVAGRKIEFLVPVEFLGGVPSKSWGYTVIVTGADVEQAGSPYALVADTSPMMTMGVARGITGNQWGIRGDVDAGVPPVVDIVSMDRDLQATVLDNYDTVSGRLAAVPGVAPPLRAVCLAPMGMEEGTRAELPGEPLGLVVGEPVDFRLFSSSVRRDDRPGDVVEDAGSLEEGPPVTATIAAGTRPAGEVVPVRLRAHVTEIGTLELDCVGPDERWSLEWNLRQAPDAGGDRAPATPPA